jgi:putative glutamine transport system permease protein
MNVIFTRDNVFFMLDGLRLTLIISLGTIVLSILFGTILALVRTYCRGVLTPLAKVAGVYIEIFRCTPNILWILWIRFTIPGDPIPLGIFAFTLFTSAVVAEIIRGGLNSIPKGQFEGAASQGFNLFQTLAFIILPQTFKNIIPSLLSQVITIIKDTSFLKVVDIAEFTRNSYVVLGGLRSFGQIITLYAFVALTYFVLNYTLSCVVRAYQKRVTIA